MKFKELIKNEKVLKVLDEMNYSEATEIQKEIIPFILDGNDVLGESQTGTGKTIAFALPIIEKMESNKKLQAIVLTPTRELAIQLEREFINLTQYMKIKTISVYGSSSIEEQIKNIRQGCEIVVGTPGRVKDLIKRGILKLSEINYFVLDEADEMLSMGFEEEIEFIFDKVNNDRQVLLFSATMPAEIKKIAENYMAPDYKLIKIASQDETPKNLIQKYTVVNRRTRLESLVRILDYHNPNRCMIFCRTKRITDEVYDKMIAKGYNVNVIHGDITQSQRIQTLDKFKAGLFNYLIATDVAARGIHVDDVDMVINYSLPESNEAYVHRIGRTGRANKAGFALTLIEEKEQSNIKSISKRVKSEILEEKIPNKKEIFENRINKIIDEVDNIEESNTSSVFDEYLSNINEYQMKAIINKLLLNKLDSSIGSDFSVDIKLENDRDKKKKKNNRQANDDATRVFLTIGKLDRINKREFLCFLEKTAGIKEGGFSGMEILPKFTFVNVNKKYLDKVLKKCNNIRYNDRLIRIEIAKK